MPVDWSDLLSDPKTLSFLKGLVARNVNEIVPTVTNDGKVVYAGIDETLGGDVVPVLDSLTAAGVLEKNTEARLLACPEHEDALDLMPRVRCAACNSMRVKKGTLYQHSCGNISPVESFSTKCAKCGKPSPRSSLKLVGLWWECDDCKTKSATPAIFLHCRRYHHDFPAAQARLVDQASYRLTAEAATELKGRLAPMMGIVEGLLASGVKVTVAGKMEGKSGVQHSFDLVLEKNGSLVPVDVKVSATGEVDVIAVLAMYAKVLDVSVQASMMVAMPAMSAEAKRTASAYGIILVEGRDPGTIAASLLNSLRTAGPDPVAPEANVVNAKGA